MADVNDVIARIRGEEGLPTCECREPRYVAGRPTFGVTTCTRHAEFIATSKSDGKELRCCWKHVRSYQNPEYYELRALRTGG
jgi:hypothetical protein